MKKRKYILTLFLAVFSVLFSESIAQYDPSVQKNIDKLKKRTETSKDDSVKIMSLIEWDNLIYQDNPELDLELNDRIISICKNALKKTTDKKRKNFFMNKMAYAYNGKAINVSDVGNFKDAIHYYTLALQFYEKTGKENGVALVCTNMAAIYAHMEMHDKSLELLLKAKEISIRNKDENNLASVYNNLGNAYMNKEDLATAEIMYLECRKLCRKLGLSANEGSVENNLGNIHSTLAENYHEKKDKLNEQREYKLALMHYQNSLRIHDSLKIESDFSLAMMNIADIMYKQGRVKEAEPLAEKAMVIVKKLNYSSEIRECANILYMIYKLQGKTGQALAMHELYTTLKDSILSEENRLEVLRREAQYEYDKKASADSIKNEQMKRIADAEISKQKALAAEQKAYAAQQDAELKNKRSQQYVLFGGLLILVAFLIFVYNRFRITNAQKKIIENQKQEVESAHHQLEEKNKEVMDSINYAKRIQSAILPPDKLIKEYLPGSFIIYEPKDIVAGDFYWLEKKDDLVLIAAADCTGHGVPGALVSVVCHGALNRAVREYGLTKPSLILNKTREIVVAEFEKSEEDVKDGMDISLGEIDLKNKNIQWAGANNPLWIIRSKELIEIKPDKQPIGKFDGAKDFTNHEMAIFPGDLLLLITDGFADQFGGPKSKKFKYSNLQKLLLENSHQSPESLKRELQLAFESWKGNLEQVDDVTIIGIRI